MIFKVQHLINKSVPMSDDKTAKITIRIFDYKIFRFFFSKLHKYINTV